jgi:hypothetical protein
MLPLPLFEAEIIPEPLQKRFKVSNEQQLPSIVSPQEQPDEPCAPQHVPQHDEPVQPPHGGERLPQKGK